MSLDNISLAAVQNRVMAVNALRARAGSIAENMGSILRADIPDKTKLAVLRQQLDDLTAGIRTFDAATS